MEVIAQSVLRPQEKTFGTRKHCNAVVEKTAELLAELHGYRNGLPTAPAILARSNLRPKDRVDGFSQCGQLQLPGLIDTCRFVQSHLGPEAISVMASDSPVTRALVKLNRLWSKKMQHHLVMEVDGERIECARPAPVGPAANAVPCAGTYFATELTFRESDHCISGTLHQLPADGASCAMPRCLPAHFGCRQSPSQAASVQGGRCGARLRRACDPHVREGQPPAAALPGAPSGVRGAARGSDARYPMPYLYILIIL